MLPRVGAASMLPRAGQGGQARGGYGGGVARAVIIGGTGAIGRAAARRLLATGWSVELTGHDPARMPRDIAAAGGRFVAADAGDAGRLRAAFGDGADLLVDCACFTAEDAARLLPLARDAASNGADLQQGRVRGRGRPPLQLSGQARLRRPGPGRPAHGGPRIRGLPERGRLPGRQGRRRAGAAGQWRPGHRAAPLQDPRPGIAAAPRVGVRQTRARPPPSAFPRPPRRRRGPPHGCRQHRRAHRPGRP